MSKSEKKSQIVRVELAYPIDWDNDEEITFIELKRPKGKHIKGLGKDPGIKDILDIASKVSGYSPRFFDELDAVDCLKVSEVIGDFLEDGQKTGPTA